MSEELTQLSWAHAWGYLLVFIIFGYRIAYRTHVCSNEPSNVCMLPCKVAVICTIFKRGDHIIYA